MPWSCFDFKIATKMSNYSKVILCEILMKAEY